MPWFELHNSDKQFYVDECDAPAVSEFRWRLFDGVPRTRGERSYPIERVMGLPVLRGNMARIGWGRLRGAIVRFRSQSDVRSWVAVFKFRCLRPEGAIPALIGHFLVIAKMKYHDVRAAIFRADGVVTIQRHIRILLPTTTNRHNLQRSVLL